MNDPKIQDRTFPLLSSHRMGWSRRVIPWEWAEAFRKQAERNHGQTLERLAQRGGLSPAEALAAHRGNNPRGPAGEPQEAEFFREMAEAAR